MLSEPAKAQFSWLKRLSVPIWAYWQFVKAQVVFRLRLSKAAGAEERAILFPRHVKRLIEIGAVLDRGLPSGEVGRYRVLGFYLASLICRNIVELAVFARQTQRIRLGQDNLERLIKFGELSLAYHDLASGKAFPESWSRGQRHRASCHVALADLYAQLGVGDTSRNLETAFEHYRMAARILEGEGSDACRLHATKVWNSLGAALLNYPTENRHHYARQAVEVLSKAKEVAGPDAAFMDALPRAIQNPNTWRRPISMTRFKQALRLAAYYREALEAGVPEDDLAKTVPQLSLFLHFVHWQLGKACRELGETEKAVKHFTAAINGLTGEADVLRAAAEVDKGYAFLEAQDGDRKKYLYLAGGSFKTAMTLSVENGLVKRYFEKPYVLALVGDAKAYFALLDLRAVKIERFKRALSILATELRAAARIARRFGMLQELEEALFLLGRTYQLQRDSPKSYPALALAARVADRLERSARTPRLNRFFVAKRAAIDDLLMRTCLHMVRAKRREKGVPLHSIFCFAERGRTAFLRTQLANLNLRPKGASESDIEELFSRRRTWHEADLRVLEQESSLASDDTVLAGLRERRNTLEAGYRSELESVRRKFGDLDYDPDKPFPSVGFVDLYSDLRSYLALKHAALVEYYLTGRWLHVFVLLETAIYAKAVGIPMDELGKIKIRWGEGQRLLRERGSLAHWERGFLGQVLGRLGPAVQAPAELIAGWEKETGQRIRRLAVVPHRFLHLLPLHAVPLPDGRAWGDTVSIQYAPSASVFAQLLRSQDREASRTASQPSARNGRKVVAVSYSPASQKQSLFFNVLEGRAVAEATHGVLLDGSEATLKQVKAAIEDATYIHFACHGSFDENAPLQSALELAAEDAPERTEKDQRGRLTLAEIFQGVRLTRAPLVVLSACETGLSKVEERHDEYIGLPAGFLYAGAGTVVSTLWRVPDVATWLLMRTFAESIAKGRSATLALRRAQKDLRGLRREYVREEIAKAAGKEPDACRRERMIDAGHGLPPDEFPFASPYWWAGFTVNGLGASEKLRRQ